MSYQSIMEHTSDGVTVNYAVPFPYLDTDHIFAYDMGETSGSAPLVVNIDHWNGPSEIVLENPLPVNHVLRIQRTTPVARMEVEYTDSSYPTEYQLNLANTQLLFLIQEQQDVAQAGQFIALVDHRSLSGLLEANQHNIQTIIGLQSALDGKAPAASTNSRITAVEAQASTNAGLIASKADKSYVDTQLAGKAEASHTHARADINGLEDSLQQIGIALNGKAPNTLASATAPGLMSAEMWTKVDGWTPSEVPLATVTVAGIVKPDGGTITVDADGTIHATSGGVGVTLHSALTGRDSADCHPMTAITGLQAALADKASAVHTHEVSEVNGLQAQLAGKVSNSVLADYVTNAVFNTAVGAKADQSFVTAALAEKAASAHNHAIADVQLLQGILDNKAPLTHASRHYTGGADAITPANIGAAPLANPAFTGTVTIGGSTIDDMAFVTTPPNDGKKYVLQFVDGTFTWVEAASGGVGGGFNTLTTITSNRTFTAPATGWYRITCIGGGGGGGAASGSGGGAGGTTSFGSLLTAAGGGGGGGGVTNAGGGGGGAGIISIAYVYLTAGQTISVTIGAGGSGGTVGSTVSAGSGSYGGRASIALRIGGGGAAGAGNGSPVSGNIGTGNGGPGAITPYGYGNGGGGGGGGASQPGVGGAAGPGATYGTNGSSADGRGGAGGPGVVILEYFDPTLAA